MALQSAAQGKFSYTMAVRGLGWRIDYGVVANEMGRDGLAVVAAFIFAGSSGAFVTRDPEEAAEVSLRREDDEAL